MRDHVVVCENELIQCKNDIVTHYFIDKLDSFSLGYGKTLGFDYTELKVGCRDQEKVLLRVYNTDKKQELQDKFVDLVLAAEKCGKFVNVADTTHVNVKNIRKVTKEYVEKEPIYKVVFKDGLVLAFDKISQELKTALSGKCSAEDQNEIEK